MEERMSGPWEDFQQTKESGPWEDFGSGKAVGFDDRIPRLPIEDILSHPVGGDMADSPMSMWDKILASPLLGGATEFAADVPANLINAPGFLVNKASQALGGNPMVYQVPRGQSIIPEVLPSLEKMAKVPIAFPPDALSPFPDTTPAAQPMPVAAGLVKGTEDVLRGLVTPETLMSLGAVKSPNLGRAIATLFGVTSAAHLPQAAGEVGRLSVEGTKADTARAALNTLAQAAIAGHVAAGGAFGFNEAYQNRPLTPEVLPPFDQRPVAPVGRQITMGEKPEGFIDLEPIKTGEGMMYKAPGDQQKLIEGPKGEFVGDALGRVIPKEQVNPLGMDVTQPGVGSEPYYTVEPKKGFSETPPLIGQGGGTPLSGFPAIEAKLNEVLAQIKANQAQIQPAYQASGEPMLGGQISFAQEAGAQNIPNAMQSKVDVAPKALEPHDAASLAAGAKMISGEGESSGQAIKSPQIEDANSYQSLVAKLKSLPNTPEGFTQKMEVQKQIEAIKNKNKGMPPGKESGSTPESDGQEPYGSRQYGGLWFLDPKFWQDNFGQNSHVQMDAKQLYNRMRNKLNEKSKTWQGIDTKEFKEFMFGKEKITPKDVADFVSRQENENKERFLQEGEKWWEGVKKEVEVRKFGNTQPTNRASRRAQLIHELDTQHPNWQRFDRPGTLDSTLPESLRDRIEQLRTIDSEIDTGMQERGGGYPTSQTHWQSISSKPESEMKDYVEIAVVKPFNKESTTIDKDTGTGRSMSNQERDIKFPSSHNFPPNTIGFGRGHMEGDTFLISEVQKDWKDEFPEFSKHWERMVLKSMVEHARAAGAKRIAIQDAESAMMMEGHDRPENLVRPDDPGRQSELFADEYDMHQKANQLRKEGYTVFEPEEADAAGWELEWLEGGSGMPSQEKGMRHHYDRLMPQIMEELTGEKGEKVSFGEHKMAFEKAPGEVRLGTGEEFYGHPRKDLIFRNPDGSPKTDVTALSYPIPDVEAPAKPTGIGKGIRAAVEKNKEAGMVFNPFRKKERPLNRREFLDVQSFGNHADMVRDLTTPQGVSKTPLLGKAMGRLFDPRSYKDTPAEKEVLANGIIKNMAENFGALWMERLKDVKRAFPKDDRQQITLANGRKDYVGDVIEAELRNPGSQPLTSAQRDFVQAWKELRQKKIDEAIRNGVKYFLDDQGNPLPINANYFPRHAVGKVGLKEKAKALKRSVVGAKPGFAKGRAFDTEREGVEKGKIQYEPDEISNVGRWLISIDKAIADQRLADSPALQGRSGTPRFLEEGTVNQPAFMGRVFPKDVADRLNAHYNQGTSKAFEFANRVNNELKAAQYTADASAPLNQGLPLLATNPARWARATALHFEAFLNDRVLNRVLKKPENLRIAKLILEGGGSLIKPQDFLAGSGKGHWAEKVWPIKASGRAMTTFLNMAKIELFKAYEPLARKKGMSLKELVEAVETASLSGKMEMKGITHGRALAERLLLNAPSYARAALDLTSMATQGGVTGTIGRRALLGLAGGLAAIMYGLYKANNMSDDEIKQRFNPAHPSFMRFPYMMNNGRRKEISVGSIFLSAARTLGRSYDKLTSDKPWGEGKDDPLISFAEARKSPLIGTLDMIRTGQDYRGEPISKTKTIARSITPVSLSSFAEHGNTESGWKGFAAESLGLNTFDESPGAYRTRKMDEEANKKYGKNYSMLTANQRMKVTGPAEKATKELGEEVSARQMLNVFKNQEEQRKLLLEKLKPESQEWLKENNLKITGFRETLEENKRVLRLANDEEKQRLFELMTKHTQERIDRMMASGRKYNQEDLQERLQLAHAKAWNEFKKSLRKPEDKK